jgi:hypothetical protein
VKDDAPDAARCERIQDRTHQCLGNAATPPRRLHVDVENDRFWTELGAANVSFPERRLPRDLSRHDGIRHAAMAGRDPRASAVVAAANGVAILLEDFIAKNYQAMMGAR